jgi:hypothetical protein
VEQQQRQQQQQQAGGCGACVLRFVYMPPSAGCCGSKQVGVVLVCCVLFICRPLLVAATASRWVWCLCAASCLCAALCWLLRQQAGGCGACVLCFVYMPPSAGCCGSKQVGVVLVLRVVYLLLFVRARCRIASAASR